MLRYLSRREIPCAKNPATVSSGELGAINSSCASRFMDFHRTHRAQRASKPILRSGVAGFLISVLRNENPATFSSPDQCESVQISGEVLSSSSLHLPHPIPQSGVAEFFVWGTHQTKIPQHSLLPISANQCRSVVKSPLYLPNLFLILSTPCSTTLLSV